MVKKEQIIPALLLNEKFILDFVEKANYFKNFYASQCTPFNSNSKIAKNQAYITNTKLSSFNLRIYIINIIRSSN